MKTYTWAVSLIGAISLVATPLSASALGASVVINQSQNQPVQWGVSLNTPGSMIYQPQYYCNGYYSYSPCQQAQYQNYGYSYAGNQQYYYPQYSQSYYQSSYTPSYSYSYPNNYYYPTSYSYPSNNYSYGYTYPSYGVNFGVGYDYTYGYDTSRYAYNSYGNNGYYGGYSDYCGCGYDGNGQMWAY